MVLWIWPFSQATSHFCMREYYSFEIYPQSSYADREAPEREHSQRDRYVLFPQPLSARVPFCLLHVHSPR
jgi:hypothetical protein